MKRPAEVGERVVCMRDDLIHVISEVRFNGREYRCFCWTPGAWTPTLSGIARVKDNSPTTCMACLAGIDLGTYDDDDPWP